MQTKCSNRKDREVITTVNLLDLLKEKLGSDYKASKALGISHQRISQLRTVGGVFTDAQGLKAAEILDFPQDWVIISLAAERSLNSPVFDILTHLADKLDTRKVGVLALFALIPIAIAVQNLPYTGA